MYCSAILHIHSSFLLQCVHFNWIIIAQKQIPTYYLEEQQESSQSVGAQ